MGSKKCKFCKSEIDPKATICPMCRKNQDETEIEFTTYLEDKDNATIFRHYKHKNYTIIGLSSHTETEEMMVIYKPLYECEYELFARPAEMFFSKIDNDKKQEYRFEKIPFSIDKTI